jgi:FkbM family methyltransferase
MKQDSNPQPPPALSRGSGSFVERTLSALLPYDFARVLTRLLLKSMGVGAGTEVGQSGEIHAMRSALKLAGIDSGGPLVLFDVGANVGCWSQAAICAFPQAAIFAFEPSAVHGQQFSARLRHHPQIRLFNCALGRETAEATLYKDTEISGMASLSQRDLSHLGIALSKTEAVMVRALDEIVAEHGVTRIDLLKIDVEGHELSVLEGARNALGRGLVSVVQFEFGGCNIDTRTYFKDFYRFFTEMGFAVHVIRPGGRLARIRRYREFNEQFTTTNYLAIREKGPGARRPGRP